MGVLNVTPDSFSDGGYLNSPGGTNVHAVIDVAAAMVEQGAHWLDLGGESTRPGAQKISEQEELERVAPALEALVQRFDTPVSVDTSSAKVITGASQMGASMINDVRALARPGALEAFAQTSMDLCLMHMQGDPESMQSSPEYESVTDEVKSYLVQRLDAVLAKGVSVARVCLDPGIGFGKTTAHNLQLLKDLPDLASIGRPILVGLSRKSLIGAITGKPVNQRLAGTIGLNMLALQAGASILRVHDVAEAVDIVKIWQSFVHESKTV